MDRLPLLIAGSAIFAGALFLFKSFRKYFVFEAHNVKFIFTLCGGHISPILTAAEKSDIRVIDVRHEATAVFAADAVSRLSGTVGVAAVTAGPGVTNTVTAIKNAQMAESPLILLAGATAGLLRGRGSLQDIDQISLFQPICKWCIRVNRVQEIVPVLCKAFHVACSNTPGPVLVEFPIDALYPYALIKEHMKIIKNPRTLRQRIMNWYLRFYLTKLFANGFLTKSTLSDGDSIQNFVHPPQFPIASDKQIATLADLIHTACRPVFVIGSQVILPPVDVHDVAQCVKDIGIPVYLSGMARGLLGRSHDLGFRHARRQALKDADLIILAGCVCDFRLDYGRVLGRKGKVVAINRNKKQLYLNTDVFWRVHLAICADVGTTIKRTCDLLNSKYHPLSNVYRCPTEWIDVLKERESKKDEEIREAAMTDLGDHVNPMKLLWKLEHYGIGNEDSNSIIVADGGDFVGTASYILRPRGPLCWLDPGPFGTLGVGGGFALGAKLCRPEADVWVIFGDGSSAYSIAEWDSMFRHKAPAIGIVGNDACWSQIARDQVTFFKSYVACQLEYTPYHEIAANYSKSLVAKSRQDDDHHGESTGFLITKANQFDIEHIFDRVKDVSHRIGKPCLVNCLISCSNFREGSTSV